MKTIIILFAAICLFAVSAFAQIEGRVVDAKGNAVAKVVVTATKAEGAVAATVTTDEDGNYAFEDLEPGKYKITTSGAAGFRSTVRENVNVAEDETTTLDITLTASVPAPTPTPQIKHAPTPVKPPAPASPVDEIVDKYINANGGREKLLSLKTVRMEGTLNVLGTDVAITVTESHLVGIRTDINVFGTANYTIVTPTKGTLFMPVQGMSEPADMPDDQFKAIQTQLDLQSPFLDYRTKGASVELLGTEKVNGEVCFNLKVTFKSGRVTTYFISSKTYLITKTSGKRTLNGQEVDVETVYSNYKKNADGFVFPYTSTNMQGVTNYSKIETNIPVDPAIFAAPH